jgi:hypothetical protein
LEVPVQLKLDPPLSVGDLDCRASRTFDCRATDQLRDSQSGGEAQVQHGSITYAAKTGHFALRYVRRSEIAVVSTSQWRNMAPID